MMDVVYPPADAGGEEALGTPVVLAHQSLVLFHGNEQRSGRAKRKEMVNLWTEYRHLINLWTKHRHC